MEKQKTVIEKEETVIEKRGGDFSQSRVEKLNKLMKDYNIPSMEISYINNNKIESWYFNCQ